MTILHPNPCPTYFELVHHPLPQTLGGPFRQNAFRVLPRLDLSHMPRIKFMLLLLFVEVNLGPNPVVYLSAMPSLVNIDSLQIYQVLGHWIRKTGLR